MALKSIALLSLLLLLNLGSAQGRHTPETPVTDYSAYTLQKYEMRMGLWRTEFGITEEIQAGTLQWLWLLKAKNLFFKWKFYQGEQLSLSTSGGFFWLNFKDFGGDAPDVLISMIPLYSTASWETGGALSYHLSAGYTVVKSDGGELTKQEQGNLDMLASVSTGILIPSLEYRTSESFALVLEGRLLLFQGAALGGVQELQIDEDTRIEIHASGEADLSGDTKGNAIFSGFWSWDSFNLRLGLGYGHFAVPTVNIFTDQVTVIPEFDLFWRF